MARNEILVVNSNEVDQGLDEARAPFIQFNYQLFVDICYISILISSIEAFNHQGLLTGRK